MMKKEISGTKQRVKENNTRKQSIKEKFEDVINSAEFENYCYHQCTMKGYGCREYCPFFHFREVMK